MQASVEDQLATLIGKMHVEILVLRNQLQVAQARIAEIEKLKDESSGKA